MASISRGPNGQKVIQFVSGSGKRKSIRLGKMTQREAETIKLRVERLVMAQTATFVSITKRHSGSPRWGPTLPRSWWRPG